MRNRKDLSRFWDKTHAPRAAGPGQLRLRQRHAERRNPAAAPAKTEGNGKKKECVCTGKAHPGSLPPHAPRLSLFYEAISWAISQRGNAAAPGAMLGPAPWLWCWDQCPGCAVPASRERKQIAKFVKIAKARVVHRRITGTGPSPWHGWERIWPLQPHAMAPSSLHPPRAEIPGLGSRQPPQPPGLSLAARLNN